MKTYNEKVAYKLNNLLQKLIYSEKGFNKATRYAVNEEFKLFFREKANQRKEFGSKLKYEINSFEGTTKDSGNLVGSWHLVWMSFKMLLSSHKIETVVESLIKEDRSILIKYKNIIADTSLPFNSKNVLLTQKCQIEEDMSKVKKMLAAL